MDEDEDEDDESDNEDEPDYDELAKQNHVGEVIEYPDTYGDH